MVKNHYNRIGNNTAMILIKRSLILVGITLLFATYTYSQKRDITLEDITTNNTFVPKSIETMVFMADGTSFAAVADSGKSIVKYDIATGNKISKILDLTKFPDIKIDKIEGFEISADDNLYLIHTNRNKIFRRSFTANYYTYNDGYHELLPLTDKLQLDGAKVSPNGTLVAFAWKNNLYLKKLRYATESAITIDGAQDSIVNGVADWLYEEEFKVTRAFEWNATSTELAFVRFDETKVKLYSTTTSNTSATNSNFYPSVKEIKYPMAGEQNPIVSVQVFNVANKTVKEMNLGKSSDIYVPRILWNSTGDKLAVARMNRLQNQFDLLLYNSASGVPSTIFSQTSETFIDPEMCKSIEFPADGKSFVITSEQDGYNHIYSYNLIGIKQAQITTGSFDVTDYYGYNATKREVYYQAADESPLRRNIWAATIDGKSKRKLSTLVGTNNAAFNTNRNFLIINNSSTTSPSKYALCNVAGKELRELQNNMAVLEAAKDVSILPKEFFSFKTSGGTELNGWLVKPSNANDGQKHPLVLMQYSGPNSQRATDSWEIGWEQYLASKGFVVACVDGRGTGARGAAFRTCIYQKLGKFETEDQVETAKYLGAKEYIDGSRVAIWGWSFGGYMACNAATNGGGTFKIAIAVAPVTNWKFYDTAYTERFLRRPRDNERGYEQNSPYYQAQNLQGRLFVIQGMEDDNVHFENLTEYADQLIANGKQFDMFVYPKQRHSLKGGNTRLHLYNMMSDYLIKNL